MAACDFCSWSKEAFPLPSTSLGHSLWRKAAVTPEVHPETIGSGGGRHRDNLTERLGQEGAGPAPRYVRHPSQSGKHGSLGPGGLSSFQITPAHRPQQPHERTPGKGPPAEPVSAEPGRR